MTRAQAEGGLPGVGLNVDDCRKTFEDLTAKGVEFLQEPSERPYGVEALLPRQLRQLDGHRRAARVHARGLRLTPSGEGHGYALRDPSRRRVETSGGRAASTGGCRAPPAEAADPER